MKHKLKILSAIALLTAITLSGCALPSAFEPEIPPADVVEEEAGEENKTEEEIIEEEIEVPEPPQAMVSYIKVTGSGVNLRKGAGTSYASVGTAEKDTLYACLGEYNGWYKTYYKNSEVYISKKYCEPVALPKSSEKIEKVINEGCKLLGVKYVYGATRYHDGTGKLLSGFTSTKFDCSSLVQYIFKVGANVDLQVNTRTQAVQGSAVAKADLQRGDLIFFTNSSRQHLTGIERIGHVALYLGDNLILHTSSDYAKIENISSTRWGYYVRARRMI